nr:hypothetical protein [Tanacetum cinerariifolium]
MKSVKKSIDERAQHKREYDTWVNERQMQTTEEEVETSKALDASLVDIESSGTESKEQDTSSRLGNDAHDYDADIRPIYDEEPMAEEREAASIKPHHIIASSKSRISSENMPRFSSNDMVHNHYLEEAKKKTQERCRNSKSSLMPPARSQSIANGSKPNPRINNQNSRNWHAPKNSFVMTKTVPIAEHSRNSRNFSDSKHFVCSTCQKCVFNSDHDSCVTQFLKEVNSRAKVSSNKTTNRNKPIEQISVPNKQDRQIPTGHRFLIKKTSIVQNKTMSPRSCHRWKPTSRIFKTFSLRWVPSGKIFTSSTTKGFKEFSTDEHAMTSDHNNSELRIHDHNNEPSSLKLVLKLFLQQTRQLHHEKSLNYYSIIT